ncbi:MAG: response regulator [Lewinellaceae bacterium]|nr:response regulator [Saprospiraceae bacterium]MCB9331165.1 response regulator [Lewinellaceae bacterium]
MHLFRPFTYCLLLLFAAVEAPAQEYRAYARRFGVEEGLPHRQVNSLMQDRRGFIWAATNGGVVRFDGRRFQVFNKSENGLSGDIVDWLAEDADGYIWAYRIGPGGWLNVIEPLSGALIPPEEYFKKHPLSTLPKNWYDPPQRLADGTLVFCAPDSVSVLQFHPNSGWKKRPVPQGRFFFLIKCTGRKTQWGLHKDDYGRISLVEVDAKGQILHRTWATSRQEFLPMDGETGDPDGFFLLKYENSGNSTLWEIDGKGNFKPALSHTPFNKVHQYARLENGLVEVAFPKITDQSGKVLIDLCIQFPELDPFQYRDYLRDKNGNIWLATTFGLVVVELRKNYFRRLLFEENAQGGRGKACRGLLEINGHLMVNTEAFNQGRFLIDLKTGRTKRLAGEAGIALGRSASGDVWTDIDTIGAGYWFVSLQKTAPDGRPLGKRFQQSRPAGPIYAILEENPQRVLLGHVNGLTVYNPQTQTAEPWYDDAFPAINTANVHSLQKDREGRIWACTEQGLFHLNPGGGVAGRFWSEGKGPFYLPYNNIFHVYEDPDGICWLSTGGSGLIRWDRSAPPGRETQVIFRKNGLLNGVVYAAYEDRHGHLWLPTDFGIVQFDKKSKQVRRTWLTADGLTNNEFNRISHCRGADGTLYFGGLNGVTAFNPDDFYTHTDPEKSKIPLVVSNFNVLAAGSGQLENRTRELIRTNRFTMYPGDRYIQLEFALLDYIASEKVTYTWKLDAGEGDWENLKEPVLRLSSLPFGTRRLRIRAQAADGTWAANELNIELTVLPPVYQRWWFLLSVLLLSAIGVRAWYLWRTRVHRLEQERLETEVDRQTATIRRQTEELKKLDEAKSRFFANVSHELRTPLTLILGPLGSLLKGNRLHPPDAAYAQTAHRHGLLLLRLVNEILDLSKMEAGKMQLHETTVSLQPFLRRLTGAFESHAERLGILFVFEYRLPNRLRVLVDEDKLQKILNNLLSNALKFTPPHTGSSVHVCVGESTGNIRIEVRDTGRGIHSNDLPRVFERFYQTAQPGAPVEGGTGIGLALCHEYVELMQGRIGVESTLGKGSVFYIEFPRKEVLGMGKGEPVANGSPKEDDTAEQFNANDQSAIAHQKQQALVGPDPQQPLLLLVEDNESLRDYVQAILSDRYTVVTAENGRIALDLLLGFSGGVPPLPAAQPIPATASRLPDLIISDVMMPVMDGFQLLETLRGDGRWRHIPVVMLTARADLRDKLRALRIGVDDYLLKPFEEEELRARVDNLLRHYQNRQNAPRKAGREGVFTGTNTPGQAVPLASAEDMVWLENFEQIVEKRLGDFNLTADILAGEMAMSRAPFFRQLKRLTGLTPAQYLDEARFQKARRLLEQRKSSSVKSAAYSVGFRQVKHFSQNFKKRFGKLPSEFIR